MKKIIVTSILLIAATATQAQDWNTPLKQGSTLELAFRLVAITVCMFLVGTFIITVVKVVLDHQLKSKMLDRGFSESEISRFFKSSNHTARLTALKWFAVLAALGFGLTVVTLTQPVGLHSLAIMAFSVAAGYLTYAQFIKRTET